ncbi:MAG: efflux RND transporter periplasmic adaptor subunit [Pseudomonadota bacterium]|jgi:RND family efflux transporter MFP subunit|nr:efflux RND transporter periplasmic adaptor subunit [Pseudomonadota bacterium]
MSEQMQDYEAYEREAKPSAVKGFLFILVLIAVVAAIGFFVLQNRSAEGPLVPTSRPVPIAVETVNATLEQAFQAEEKFTGIVTAKRTSQLGFPAGGRIASLRADLGSKVSAGQTLAVLDTRSLRAQLAAAQASISEAEASYQLAESTVDRQIALLEKGHVSSQRVDEARAQSNTALARIQAATANADALRVQIDLARIQAPFDGTITARLADEGAIAGPGQPVFELVETGRLEARLGLTAKLAARLDVGEAYELTSDQGPVLATLRSVTGVIDTTNRTVSALFDVVDADSVPAGAVVRLSMIQDIDEPGLWLPVSALTESDRGLWSIYVARRDGSGWVAEPGIVEIVHQSGDRVYVRGAVRDGDRVIMDGLQRITPGQPVTPVEVSANGLAAGNG